jgi:hypothetical protein
LTDANITQSSAPIFIDSDSEDSTPYNFEPSPAPRSRRLTPSVASSPLPSIRNQKSPRRVLDLLGLPSSSTGIATKKRALDSSASTYHMRKHAKKDLTPKLRHNDSQIEFAAIESSPVVDNGESQILTDRQREVRERQQAEAAMFPDLRSSLKGKKPSGSKLELTSNRPVSEDEENRPTTPSLLPKEAMSDDFITSSPTPRRTGNNAVVDENGELNMDMNIESDAIDLPSSPPKRTITSGDRTPVASLPLPASRAEDAAKDIWDDIPSPPTGHHVTYNRSSSIARRDGLQNSTIVPKPPKDLQVPSQQSEPELPRKKGPVGKPKIGENLAAGTESGAIAQLPSGTKDVFVDTPLNPIMESEAQSAVLQTTDKPVTSALSLPQLDVPQPLDGNMLTGSSQKGRRIKPAKSNSTGKRQGLRSRASQVSLDETADYSEGDESSLLRLIEGFDGTPVGTPKSKPTFGDVSSTRSISLRSATKFDKEEYEVVPGSSPIKLVLEEQGKTEAEEIISKKARKRKATELDGDDSAALTPVASLVPDSVVRRTRSHSNNPSISMTSTPVSRGKRFTRTNSKLGEIEDIIGGVSKTPAASAQRTRSSLNAIEKSIENMSAESGKDTTETEGSFKDAEGNQTEISDSQPTGKEKEVDASSSKSANAKSKHKSTTPKARSREEKQSSQAKDTAKARRTSSRLYKDAAKETSPEIIDDLQARERSSEAKPRKKRKVHSSEAGSVSSLSELDNAEFEEYETAPEPAAENLDNQELQNNAHSSNTASSGRKAARGRGSRGRGRGKGRTGKAIVGETKELAERARASSPSVDLDAPINPTTVSTAPETQNPPISVSLKKEERSDVDMDKDSDDEDRSLSDVSNINDPQVQEDIREGRLDVHGYWPEPGSRIYVPGTTQTTIVRDHFHQHRMPWGDSDSEDYDSSGIEDWEMLYNIDQALESVEKGDDEIENSELPKQSKLVDGIGEEVLAEETENLADEEQPPADEPLLPTKVDFYDEIANESEIDAEAEAQIMQGLSQMSQRQHAELSGASSSIDPAISSSAHPQTVEHSVSRPVPAARGEQMPNAPAPAMTHSPLSALEDLLEMVKNASLSREDAAKMENLMWDLKGEVYLAERRTRG